MWKRQQPRRRAATRADPIRTCVGCRRRGHPDTFVRLTGGVAAGANSTDTDVRIGRNEPGRGAWLCTNSHECFDQAVRRRAIARALRTELSEQEIARLRARLHGAAPEGARPDGRVPYGEG